MAGVLIKRENLYTKYLKEMSEGPPGEGMAICKPRRNIEQVLLHNCQKGSTLPTSSFWTSNLQNCETMHSIVSVLFCDGSPVKLIYLN